MKLIQYILHLSKKEIIDVFCSILEPEQEVEHNWGYSREDVLDEVYYILLLQSCLASSY